MNKPVIVLGLTSLSIYSRVGRIDCPQSSLSKSVPSVYAPAGAPEVTTECPAGFSIPVGVGRESKLAKAVNLDNKVRASDRNSFACASGTSRSRVIHKTMKNRITEAIGSPGRPGK